MSKTFLKFGAILLLVLLLGWVYLPVVTKYRELKIQEEKMAREIEDLDKKIEALEEEKKLLREDVAYIEKVIRDEMGLVRPGEMVYKIIEEAPPETPSETLNPQEETL